MATYHVLIADDVDSVRSLLARIITRTYPSARISVVADGDEALEIYTQEGASLIITDNEMPRMDGLSLVATIRERSLYVPIIMISSNSALAAQAHNAGANAFLGKPFLIHDFVQTVTRFLPAQ